MRMKLAKLGKELSRRSVIGIPFIWLFLFFLLPFIIVLKVSLAESDYNPPYQPLLAWAEDQLSVVLYYGNYVSIFKDDDWSYLDPYLGLLKLALIATIFCMVIGYFIAFALTQVKSRKLQLSLLWATAIPTMLVIIMHLYAYFAENTLAPTGILNYFLTEMGLISQPIELLNNSIVIYTGTILTHLSLAVFPLFFVLQEQSFSNLTNAKALRFPRKTIALTIALVFICIMGKYLIPNPLGFTDFEGSRYLTPYLNSIEMAFFSTLFCLMLGYPIAYAISKAEKSAQTALILLIVMPTWTALLIRVYAWMTILGNGEQGLMNQFLMGLGIISHPIEVLNTYIAVYIGVVYAYLPFMVLPLYANLAKHDQSLLEAAADLGTKKITAFWKITFPLSKAGIVAGCMLVFIPVIGEFVIPELLGGSETQLIGQAIYREYFTNNNWPSAAALAVIMLALLIIPIILFNRNQSKSMEGK